MVTSRMRLLFILLQKCRSKTRHIGTNSLHRDIHMVTTNQPANFPKLKGFLNYSLGGFPVCFRQSPSLKPIY